ncbi:MULTISPECIES: FAD-dependent oxidoreductase [Pseudomonas]|uniref:FAD-dependent oxidoreductase n=1 Tax=Pseudomonas TaxID=286 RepID=UPI000D2134EC|nr:MULTISPECIES: FAD-dependent oxidoreductase [Pseudomonas]AVZ17495.1 FAD-dependent oxidoreductase [Pseudomonas aeruginosa]MCT5442795.1 FAD-binding oxidoreductase [Pseudomonas aeruginosa]HBO0069027.1 FAD-binding oxidoreductase [Pseudomonas aeruginosa]HBO3184413.1 FAD-binding oxidoreductase [Pseudomonas aeruginosa]HBO4664851.1 FAD-binding oxidoreductase [Pseudomonas aeruginosa]
MDCDILVLGAGIVGVSTALHLQARGRDVCLIDRAEPGSGTSHGNAGLIERASVVPYAFPRSFTALLRYGLNRQPDVRYSPAYLPKIAPWLASYWHHSSAHRLEEASRAMLPLVERCVAEHDQLVAEAGLGHLIRARGWMDVYRSPEALGQAANDARALDRFGLRFDVLDGTTLRQLEPHLGSVAAGGIHWHDPKTVLDPGALVRGYAELFVRRGGRILKGDATSLRQQAGGWQVRAGDRELLARQTVVAMGPQSGDLFRALGYRIPLAIKRGYHMHYAPAEGAELGHSVCDAQGGYVLAPMARGIRLTTGIEFAHPDDPANEIQLRRAERLARELFPLGQRRDAEPWLGRRPCLPDMRPVIGPAPDHPGLWFNFGHAHHGLTLGPVSGRLLAEMMTGARPFTDPTPYGAQRFR